jgi:hypothetical protein
MERANELLAHAASNAHDSDLHLAYLGLHRWERAAV